MAQTPEGAMKTAAKAAGLSLEDYQARLAAGLGRCTRCKTWKARDAFGNDRTRPDGRDRTCFDCRRVPEPRKPPAPSFKGRTHTEANKRAIGDRSRGNTHRLGKRHTPETIAKIRATQQQRGSVVRGPAHYAWKGGAKARALDERRSPEYEAWRRAVYRRDQFTCQDCGDARGGNLHAHHIQSFADHPELRLVLDNGVTLCKPCHELRHGVPA